MDFQEVEMIFRSFFVICVAHWRAKIKLYSFSLVRNAEETKIACYAAKSNRSG